ncbi:hypothetical protein MLD38_028039 [Melastoma candidum]|uniref:Uncharacterized protein n=1 Tax=Melastoma candidum TaxID=119954 RepID=A0ACB9N203_9MYRT|nr:hypothetical protein MLD38_028039 [Melastoma candidum]
MIGNSEEEGINGVPAKEEGSKRTNNEGRIARTSALSTNPSTSTSSRQWSAFRNPRIVRVSRTFGGKDRHCKVCTIRGVRDRRIRLSVPTAVQLYDLQDKLGLGQPSKVIDWLLDASKEDIDNLPPLQMLQGFGHHHFNTQRMLLPGFHEPVLGFLKDGMLDHTSSLSRRHGININESYAGVDHYEGGANSPHDRAGSLSCSTHLHLGSLRAKQKSPEFAGRDSSKGKWVESHTGQSYGGAGNGSDPSQQGQVSAQNFFPIVSYSLSGLPPVNPMSPYGHNAQGELPSSLSLSRYGSHGHQFQRGSSQGSNAVTVAAPHTSSTSPSSSPGLAPSQQMLFCPPYPQQMGHHQMLSSSMKPFQGNIGGK